MSERVHWIIQNGGKFFLWWVSASTWIRKEPSTGVSIQLEDITATVYQKAIQAERNFILVTSELTHLP